MVKTFLKKQIISTNTAISSKNATAPMVLEMMTVTSLSELAVGIRGGKVDELMVGIVVIGGVVDELTLGAGDWVSEKYNAIISNHR